MIYWTSLGEPTAQVLMNEKILMDEDQLRQGHPGESINVGDATIHLGASEEGESNPYEASSPACAR